MRRFDFAKLSKLTLPLYQWTTPTRRAVCRPRGRSTKVRRSVHDKHGTSAYSQHPTTSLQINFSIVQVTCCRFAPILESKTPDCKSLYLAKCLRCSFRAMLLSWLVSLMFASSQKLHVNAMQVVDRVDGNNTSYWTGIGISLTMGYGQAITHSYLRAASNG
jgi:hypothetical protein